MKNIFAFILFFSLSFSSIQSFAWGNRGHYTVCEAAVFLVQNKNLSAFLKQKVAIMGHLCNVPDTHWKNIGSEVRKQGDATHFVDPEIIGVAVQDIPLDYQQLIKKYKGTKNLFKEGTVYSIPLEFGSNWWRADQFYRRAVSAGKDWKKVSAPKNSKEEQDEEHPFNKVSFDFYVSLGLMGHFVGDNGQPFHGTADYDGYDAGHGGIHAYFEDSIVAEQPYTFTTKIVEEGLRLQKLAASKNKGEQKLVPFLTEKTVVEKMRALATAAVQDIPIIYELDPVKEPSVQKSEKGMNIRTAAKRADAGTVAAKFEGLLVTEMARSAVLLAQIWDLAYKNAGEPKLNSYKSYKYPFTPDFVTPDYFDLSELEKKAQ